MFKNTEKGCEGPFPRREGRRSARRDGIEMGLIGSPPEPRRPGRALVAVIGIASGSPVILTVMTAARAVSGTSVGSPAGSGSPSTSSRQYSRHRITRVNLRDFIFYMEQERETARSLLLYRALLK
ncbi:hypothetical protein AAFF_G00420700 [Aldrovandia affinis]|uniref:Transcription initiation factor TFIID component TAF4 C-terminal domain-containing protein n=1 Tax=Aldrovandia affinis TaxID=143900 RepID=A0AAD7SA44_9TELE|nr:hypothetical protein AAFF_G00420700 [Aldrovandia affinis]